MKIRAATPLKYERSAAFVTRARGCGLEDVRVPIYHVSAPASALRALRRAAHLGLSNAADRLGIGTLELLGLERGQFVPEDPKEWVRMLKILETEEQS